MTRPKDAMPNSVNGYAISSGTYNSKPSPLYRQAVATSRKLADTEGIDAAERAFAESIHDHWGSAFIASRKVSLSRGEQWAGRLLGTRGGSEYPADRDLTPPGADHVSLWNRDGKPALFVFQPYHLPWETLRYLVGWCERHRLGANVNARGSWWFPGSTLLVEIGHDRPSKLRSGPDIDEFGDD